jgi:hypothetical protein
MYAHLISVGCCLLLLIDCLSERSPVFEVRADALSHSATLRTDIRCKTAQADGFVLKTSALATSDHGSQQRHPSNEHSASTSQIDKGMLPIPGDATVRRKCDGWEFRRNSGERPVLNRIASWRCVQLVQLHNRADVRSLS